MRKKLILVAAPPASGKTVVSERIAKELGHVAYFDKDTLSPVINRAFDLAGAERDMDSEFYRVHIRPVEYETIFALATEALRYEDIALINAPFGKEIREPGNLRAIRERLHRDQTDLVVLWILATPELCYERMKKRNSPRDVKKLQNWEAYVSTVNYDPPTWLLSEGEVDAFWTFDTSNREAFETSLKQTLEKLTR